MVRRAEPQQRVLYLTPEAYDWCFPPRSHPDPDVTDEALAYAHDQMDAFVYEDYLDEETDLKPLHPEEKGVWEIRTNLDRRIRLFGWFPRPRTFVVVHGKLRSRLGKFDSQQWTRAIQKVVDVRRQLALHAFRGFSFTDYI